MLPKIDWKEFLNIPNRLTLFRVAAIPGVVVLLYYPNRFSTFIAALLFSAAAITDCHTTIG